MTFYLFHPRRDRLHGWLDGSTEPKLDRHVESCDRCASRLESFAPALPNLRDALVDALAPPADFAARLEAAVAERAAAKADLELLAGLMALPWQTSRLLMRDDENRPPAVSEGPENEQVD